MDASKRKIKRIVIGGTSGGWIEELAYSAELVVSKNSMRLIRTPEVESEENEAQSFSYNTDSPLFVEKYEKLCGMIPELMKHDQSVFMVMDAGAVSIEVSYSKSETRRMVFYDINDVLNSFLDTLLAPGEIDHLGISPGANNPGDYGSEMRKPNSIFPLKIKKQI